VRNESILLMFHCEQNTGYAIGKLECVFKKSALHAGYEENNIFWSYSKLEYSSDNMYELSYQSIYSAKKSKNSRISQYFDHIGF
jgi:hypothetical protein